MDLVNSLYGKNHAALRTSIWEKGYKEGKMEGEHGLSPQVVTWLDRAMAEYYRKRAYNILSQVETRPSDSVLKQWEELLEDMHGDDQDANDAFYEIVMKDDQVSPAAKNWIKKISK